MSNIDNKKLSLQEAKLASSLLKLTEAQIKNEISKTWQHIDQAVVNIHEKIKNTNKTIVEIEQKGKTIVEIEQKGDKGDPGLKGERGDSGSMGRGIKNIQLHEDKLKVLYTDNTTDILNSIVNTGDEGRGIAKTFIKDNNLILEYTDKQLVNLGRIVGPAGPRGFYGDKGTKGDKGEKGLIGEAGGDGIDGADGADGARGEIGFPGAKGGIGSRGLAGETGSKGDKGDPGESGLTGKIGPKGDKGEPGLKGKDANITPLENKFEKLSNNIDVRISRIATTAALSGTISGSGEVNLYALDDVDRNSVSSPTDGHSLVYKSSLGKWQANTISGGGGGLAVANSFSKLTSYSANTSAVTTSAHNVALNAALLTNPGGHITLLLPSGTTIKIPYWT